MDNIKFDKDLKVKLESLTKEQAEVFILFLQYEMVRHHWDIKHAEERIQETRKLFGL